MFLIPSFPDLILLLIIIMQAQREDESNKPIKCGICNKKIKFKRNLRTHIKNVHGTGSPDKAILVVKDKQKSVLSYCSSKKPRLEIKENTLESSSNNKINVNKEDTAKENEEFEHLLNFETIGPTENNSILSELKKINEKLDTIEKNTKPGPDPGPEPGGSIDGRIKVKPKKVKEPKKINDSETSKNELYYFLCDAKSISQLLNRDEIKLFQMAETKSLYCSICFNETNVKEYCSQNKTKISGKKIVLYKDIFIDLAR